MTLDDALREIVVRRALALNSKHHLRRNEVVFLATESDGAHDPSPALLRNLANGPYRVLPLSQAARTPQGNLTRPVGGQGIYTRSDQRRGSLLSLIQVRQLGQDRLAVDGRLYRGIRDGTGWVVVLDRKKGRWEATDAKISILY